MKVKMEDVLEAIFSADDDTENYYSIKTEEVLMCFDGMVNGVEESELKEDIEENFEDYIRLPGNYEIDEYSMMVKFIEKISERSTQDKLTNAIRGRGAFHRFKNEIYYLGIDQKWFDYRDSEFLRIAREWCLEKGITLVEET